MQERKPGLWIVSDQLQSLAIQLEAIYFLMNAYQKEQEDLDDKANELWSFAQTVREWGDELEEDDDDDDDD